jgi:hypothetical protein
MSLTIIKQKRIPIARNPSRCKSKDFKKIVCSKSYITYNPAKYKFGMFSLIFC